MEVMDTNVATGQLNTEGSPGSCRPASPEEPIAKWPKKQPQCWLDFSVASIQRKWFADCSLLTILLRSNGPLCSHESQKETGPVGSLPYVWREARRKM